MPAKRSRKSNTSSKAKQSKTPRGQKAERSPRHKFTAAEVERHVSRVLQAVERHRHESQTEHFIGMSADDVREALARVNSPFIMSVGWASTTPGGSVNVTVGIHNPDPVTSQPLLVHVFIGPTIGVTGPGEYLLNVDTRFPRLAEPGGFGLSVPSGSSTFVSFALAVPSSIQKSNYIANAALLQKASFATGTLLSRAMFVLSVL